MLQGKAWCLTLRPGAFASWPVRPRSRDMGRAAITGAMDDARVEPASISALYVGNMLSGMLPDQQHVGPLLATATGLRGVEASTVEACCGSGILSCLLQEGGCVGSRYASCRAREFIKSHQHTPGPCASAPSSAVHASLVRAGVFMCGSLPARHHRPLRLVHTNMCLLPIPALFRRRRRLPLCCPVQL